MCGCAKPGSVARENGVSSASENAPVLGGDFGCALLTLELAEFPLAQKKDAADARAICVNVERARLHVCRNLIRSQPKPGYVPWFEIRNP